MEHAHWITEKKRGGGSRHTCSKCEFWFEFDPYCISPLDIKEFKYCPNCGAKMDKEKENEIK